MQVQATWTGAGKEELEYRGSTGSPSGEQGYAGKILDWFHFSEYKEATLADYLAN